MWTDVIGSIADELYIANRDGHIASLSTKIENSILEWEKEIAWEKYMSHEKFKKRINSIEL